MNYLLILFLFLLTTPTKAQTPHSTCNNTRYLTEVFAAVDTTFNILYGVNTTHAGNTDSLYMDVYQPVGDTASNRPLIILAFGGSFVLGERTDMAPLCHYYAQHGYVAATIDYRLFDGLFVPFPDSTVFADVVMKALGDMKASIRHFRADAATANLYRIDTNLIFVGGGSAGAIMALHAAYLDTTDTIPPHIQVAINNNGGHEGNTSANTQYSSTVQGVINFSGALGNAAWIDAGDVPVFSVHDDNDNIVPYGQGYGTIAGFPISYLEGSQVIADTATALGIPNVLITIPNSNSHVSYVDDPLWQDSVFTGTLLFLHEIICPLIASEAPISFSERTVNVYPNPVVTNVVIEVDDPSTAYDLTMYDNLGQIIYHQEAIRASHFVLNRQKIAAGVYYLELKFEDHKATPITTKVILR
ncbi:T9SS type A sorting domain-containing protein [Aureispira anguillae]|uniref:T9SS type A sorting domain-containing protein n=1 Tax=Aureispira anguillae TaxID=2864201 RepID=A0A916DQR8_9BACT|nr:T9SS type A sorting domain-containing protein [Aureispira anguillae]BDS10240.1 T9SS type A sorting domain-containing protein [Aureispira anguillae]